MDNEEFFFCTFGVFIALVVLACIIWLFVVAPIGMLILTGSTLGLVGLSAGIVSFFKYFKIVRRE